MSKKQNKNVHTIQCKYYVDPSYFQYMTHAGYREVDWPPPYGTKTIDETLCTCSRSSIGQSE